MLPLLLVSICTISLASTSLPKNNEELSPYRWNLVPKQLLKRLCNLDDSLPICAWKRHRKVPGKSGFSKWQICRDHPELNICKWHNGGMITIPVPSTTTAKTEDSAEAPPTSDSIFVNEPDMMLSSKWSNAEILRETVQKELTNPHRFEGRLNGDGSEESPEGGGVEKFDESIMSANQDVFSS